MAETIRGKKFSILKYLYMSVNAFGLMIGIFLVLFGISYPEEKFPGGYKGKETAAIAGGFIFFTLIGYCGAHHQKIYALILYSIIVFVFILGNVILWVMDIDMHVLDPESRTVYFVSGLFLILMVIGVVLSWQIRRHLTGQDTDSMPSSPILTEHPSPAKGINNNVTMMTRAPPDPPPPPIDYRYQQPHQHQHHHQHHLRPSSSASFVHVVSRAGERPPLPGSYQ